MPDRRTIEVGLEPVAGDRFQPTGFPDVGAAAYQRPVGEDGWESCLLVESAQSMANHLEQTAWDDVAQRPVAPLAALPYVRVVDADGRFLTASRLEAHRLASAYVRDSTIEGASTWERVKQELGIGSGRHTPRDLAAGLFRLDPMTLVHGVFFAEKEWDVQPKVARALTAFVEAHDVREAVSGGVKRDDVDPTGSQGGGAQKGYGMVPFHRVEYTARRITAAFVLDLYQLRSYGLDEAATALLEVLALWEVRALLDTGFRPRTACDLVAADPDPEGLPPLTELSAEIEHLAGACASQFEGRAPLEVVWSPAKSKKKVSVAAVEAGADGEEDS